MLIGGCVWVVYLGPVKGYTWVWLGLAQSL